MAKLWDILGVVFILVAVFLLLFYWKGATEVGGTLFRGLTDTIGALQGKDAFGRLPTQYPQ